MYLATVSQLISPSRPAPYVLTTSSQTQKYAFIPIFQALAVVIIICAEEQEDLLLLMASSSSLTMQSCFPFIWEGLHRQIPSLGSSQQAHRSLSGTLPFLAAGLPAWLRQQFSLCLSLLLPTGLICPLCCSCCTSCHIHCATGQTQEKSVWMATLLQGVNGVGQWLLVCFHRADGLDYPFVSIILGCLNYLWIHGF